MELKLGWLFIGHSLSFSFLPKPCISCKQDKFEAESFLRGFGPYHSTRVPALRNYTYKIGSTSLEL